MKKTAYYNLLILGILSVLVVIGIWKFSGDEDNHPCSKNKFPGNCYQVEREVCNKQWSNSENECRKIIEGLKLPPSRLTGPILDRCQRLKFEKVFHYMRIQSSECSSEVNEIESWHRSNPDF